MSDKPEIVVVVHSTSNPIEFDTKALNAYLARVGYNIVGVEYQWDNGVAFQRMVNRHVPVDEQTAVVMPPLLHEKVLDGLWGVTATRVRGNPEILEHDQVDTAWRAMSDALIKVEKAVRKAQAIEAVDRAKADVARAERALANLDTEQ